MLTDFLILAPVTFFILWLFWYSAPAGRPALQRRVDIALALLAVTCAALVLAGLHAGLDLHGMDKHVIAVATAYLVLLAMMGLAWWRRHRWGTSGHKTLGVTFPRKRD